MDERVKSRDINYDFLAIYKIINNSTLIIKVIIALLKFIIGLLDPHLP
jgi:hypothetical protein